MSILKTKNKGITLSSLRFCPLSVTSRCALLALILLLLSGCNEPERISIQVGNINAKVEVAALPEIRRKGLMGRAHLGKDEGMLLVFPREKLLQMWMLNTLIPLDVGFFDSRGLLLNMVTMEPDGGKEIHKSTGLAIYALEMNKGWFSRHGIQPGVTLQLPYAIQGE